jgi:hypothetical protein
MARYNGSGWHHQSVRHSNARKYGRAGGKYAGITKKEHLPLFMLQKKELKKPFSGFEIEGEGNKCEAIFYDENGESIIYRGTRKGCEEYIKQQKKRLKEGKLIKESPTIWKKHYGTSKIPNAYKFLSKHMPRWAKSYYKENPKEADISYFQHITPSQAEALQFSKDTKLELKDAQNFSPKAGALIEFAKEHNGKLGGYIIPSENGREDARVTIETIYLPDEKTAKEYAKKTKPDEFGKEGKYWRLWWD